MGVASKDGDELEDYHGPKGMQKALWEQGQNWNGTEPPPKGQKVDIQGRLDWVLHATMRH